MIRFKYKKEQVGFLGKTTLRPVAKIFLQTKENGWYKFTPYIDSGADVTVLPHYVGHAIGLVQDGQNASTLGGVGGKTKTIYTKIKMKIGEKEFLARVAWAMDDNIPPLLGRADVFNKFKITFDEAKEEIIFD